MRGMLWLRFALPLLAVAAIAGSASAAYDAWIKWDDQLNPVKLTFRANPDYGGPGIEEYRFEYYVEFTQMLDYPQVLHAVGWGGSFTDQYGDPIRVRIKQTIQNVGTEWWNNFHILVGGEGGFPYKKWSSTPPGWNIDQELDLYYYYCDPGFEIGPGGSFYDGIVLQVIPDEFGNGQFELWKRASVPEPAVIAGLLTGLAAMGAGIRYRKIRK